MKKIIDSLNNLLPDRRQTLTRCVSSRNSKILYLEDNETIGKTIFLDTDESEDYLINNCFKIDNLSLNDILLWSIDGCFAGKGQHLSEIYSKKCDCAFGFNNFIGFIEFKTNADPLAHPLTISRNRETACMQLGQTICFLRDTLKTEGYEIEAYICTPPTYPNKNTALTDLAIEFLERYNIKLFEKNEKNTDDISLV